MPKASPSQMKRDHAISRGLKRDYSNASKLVDKNVGRMQVEENTRNKRKGLDKRKGVWYTLGTIKVKLKERITKMAKQVKTNNQEPAAAPAVRGKGLPTHGVYGILLLTVCVSAGYMTFLVLTGTTGLFNQIMAAPTVIAIGLYFLFKAYK